MAKRGDAHENWAQSIVPLPGNRFAVASSSTVKIWNDQGECLSETERAPREREALTVTADGRLVKAEYGAGSDASKYDVCKFSEA